jgi:trigger factor
VAELREDVKKELIARKQSDAEQKFADELLTKITDQSTVAIPEILINEQLDRLERDERQNLVYRGQTWKEFLEAEKLTDDTYRKQQRPAAEMRVKAGLVLSTISEAEKITVTQEEIDAYMLQLQARYPDAAMQAELAKPEARRDIASRMLTDKTLAKLTTYATAK